MRVRNLFQAMNNQTTFSSLRALFGMAFIEIRCISITDFSDAPNLSPAD